MDGILAIKALVKATLLPPVGPVLVALAGIALLRSRPRTGAALASIALAVLLVLSTPFVAAKLVTTIDRSPALDRADVRDAGAIVILGGGVRRHAAEYGGDTLGRLTLERVRYGARVARATSLPVLVSGGAVEGSAEAALMRSALEQEFGVPVRWVEDASRNTHENAVNSARMLAAAGVTRIVLVAHSFDIPRATIEFNGAGLAVVAAPTGIPADTFRWGDLVPSVAGLQLSYYACYEMLALLALRSS